MPNNLTLTIHPIPTLKDNYVWTLINSSKKSAIIVDPGEAKPVLQFLSQKGLSLRAILVTHHHWDHTNGIPEIIKQFPVPVYKKTNAIETITIPEFPSMQIIPIPGHTLDHIAYYAPGSPGFLFCGDTLFAAGCGRIFEGSVAEMFHSLQTLAALPDDTLVYCGHEYTLDNLKFASLAEPINQKMNERIKKVTALLATHHCSLPSTIKEEKETNPFLRCHVPELQKQVENHANKKLDNDIAVFAELRKWKDHF